MKTAFTKLPIGVCLIACSLIFAERLHGEIEKSAPDGFSITIKRSSKLAPEVAYQTFIRDFSKWYDASHSYSGKPENLSLDLEKHCMHEKLPNGGFVRHMEIVFHQPGKLFRMSGGLGPLQGMGVSGTLDFVFVPSESGTDVLLKYTVTGSSFQQLDKIAGPVNGVLQDQLDRFVKFSNESE